MPGTRRTRDELLVYKDQDPLGRYAEFQNPRTDMPILSPGTAETNGSIHNLGDQQLALRQGLDAIAQLEQGLGNIQNPLQRPTGTPDEQRALFANAFQQGGVTPNGSPSHPLFGDQPQPGMFDGLAMRLQNAHAIGQGTLPFWMQMQQAQQGMLDNQQMMQLKRQQLQQQLEQQKQGLEQHQWKQLFDVFGNPNLSPPQQEAMLKQMAKAGHPMAFSAAQTVNANMIADFKLVQDRLGMSPEEIVQGLQSGEMSWADLGARVKVEKKALEDETHALAEQNAQQRKMQSLRDRFKADPESLNDEELGLLEKQHQMATERKLKIQELQQKMQGDAIDLAAKRVLPQVSPEIPGPDGSFSKGVYYPQTGQSEIIRGEKGPLVKNVLPAQETAFEKGIGDLQAKQIDKSFTAAEDAASIIKAGNIGQQLLDSGMYTGLGAEWRMKFGQALQLAGYRGQDDPIANTQTYMSLVAKNVGKFIKDFGAGTGLSDEDRKLALKIAAGDVSYSEKGLRDVLRLNDTLAREVINKHNEKVKNIKTKTPLSVEAPASYKPTPAKKIPSPSTMKFDTDEEALYQQWKQRQGVK